MKYMIIAALALTITLFSGTAQADEEYPLLTHKAWTVELVENKGRFYCNAQTRNRRGDALSMVVYPDSVVLFVFLDLGHWKGNFLDDLEFDIDYKAWTLNDANFHSDDINYAEFVFPGGEAFNDWVDDMYQGTAIALKSPDRKSTISTWSLAGSAAALTKLAECGTRLPDNPPSTYGPSSSESYGAQQYGEGT